MKRCIVAGVSLTVGGIMAFQACVWLLPFPLALTSTKPASTWINDRSGVALAACVATDDQWRLPLREEEISPHLLRAMVAVEDERFFDHHGVDWKSVLGSAWDNVSSFRTRRGASTLSMQLVRLRMPASRSFANKLIQAIRAQQLENRGTKRQILIDYINEAPFGGNLVGAGAASWRYFGKPCSQLSLAEAALLAGLPQKPNYLRPNLYPERAKMRRDHVLDRMHHLAMIDDDAYTRAIAEPVQASWNLLPQLKNSSDGATPTLLRLAELYRGHTITLSLDPTVQQTAAALAREQLESLRSSGVNSAAGVVLDTQTAELLAAVSLNDRDSKIDLTRVLRSTGSTLKPFIYACAVDGGLLTMASKLEDSPRAWTNYTPANFDKSFRGELSAAEALAESRNIPAMTILSRVGVTRAINVLGACGIKSVTASPQRYGLPLAIGGAEATPLQIAEAYATLARGGEHREIQLTASSPTVQEEPRDLPLTRDTCLAVLAALSNPDRTARLSPEAANKHVAWKTGTSSGRRDAWCAAVTPRRTVVVWFGNEKGQGSPVLIGTDAAAPLALKLISTIDPDNGGFDPPPIPTKSLASAPLAQSRITILSPSNGEQLVLDPDSHTSIALKAHRTGSDEQLWWFVDGNPSDGNQWQPTAGSHEIRVVDANGVSAISRVIVRSY